MRLRTKLAIPVGLVGATTVVAVVLATGPASAGSKASPVGHGTITHVAGPNSLPVLYDQFNNADGDGLVSQVFEPELGAYDSATADDFVVPAGQKWVIKQLVAGGVQYGTTKPLSVTMYFYNDNGGGLPGTLAKSATATEGDSGGTLTMKVKGVKLGSGHWWVAVVANMPSNGFNNRWFFGTRTVQSNSPGAFINNSDAWGTGCSAWGQANVCAPVLGSGVDYLFTLYGSIV
ncbi:MAG: hypothetical protein ACJ735_17925 [Actinomycetes bacterium]